MEKTALAELAKKSHLSQRHFTRFFRKIMEQTPMHYRQG
jgi:transcriptional regulator GlxA family with amidase domain